MFPGKITPLKARYPCELQNELLKANGPLVIEFNHPDDSSSQHWGECRMTDFSLCYGQSSRALQRQSKKKVLAG